QISQRSCYRREVLNEPPVVSCQTQKTPHLRGCTRCFPVQNNLHLGRINSNTFLGNDVSQKMHRLEPKLTLTTLSKQLMRPESLKNSPQVLKMSFLIRRIYQHIINEHDHKLIQVRSKHPVHKIHEHCRSIC